MTLLRRGYETVAVSIEWLTAALTLGLVLLVSANVIARYVLSTGLPWAEELTRLIFVWVVFLGAYVALRRGAHLAITTLVDRLPLLPRLLVILIGQLLVGLFLLVLVIAGSELVQQSLAFETRTPVLQLSIAWSYLPILVGSTLMLMHVTGQLVVTVSQIRGREETAGKHSEVPAE